MAWRNEFIRRPWAELEAWYTDLALHHADFDHLLSVVRSVRSSDKSDALAGTTSMHDLVVADTPVHDAPLEVIIVRAPGSLRPPAPGAVRIEHLAHSGSNDEIERPASEAVPLFWQFVADKFGIAQRPSGDA